jgi:DNA-binding NarL/FixJ family response regulator
VIRVLIADDETLMRTGIRLILETAEDIEVVAEAGDGPAAAHACRNGGVDVALLDVRMPGGDGLSAAARINHISPNTRVLVLTTFHDQDAVTTALRSGVAGFLLKDTGPTDLIHAVRTAARGEPVLAPQVMRDLVRQHLGRVGQGDGSAPGQDAAAAARRRIAELSPAERTVLQVLAQGAANGEIAQQLYMSTGTVKAHISRILTKLDCDNRVQAAILAHEAGLLGSTGPGTTTD